MYNHVSDAGSDEPLVLSDTGCDEPLVLSDTGSDEPLVFTFRSYSRVRL